MLVFSDLQDKTIKNNNLHWKQYNYYLVVMLAVHLNVMFLVIINKILEHREKVKKTQVEWNKKQSLIMCLEPQVRLWHYILVNRVPLVSHTPLGLHALCLTIYIYSVRNLIVMFWETNQQCGGVIYPGLKADIFFLFFNKHFIPTTTQQSTEVWKRP